MSLRLTASKRALYRRCQYFAIPATPWDDVSSDSANAGNEAHEGFAAAHDGTVVTLSESARRKVDALRPSLGTLQSMGPRSMAEVALAWDPRTDTARVLGVGRASYVYALDHEMCGTADLLVFQANNVIGVADHKNDPGRDVDATDQLRTLALFAARAFGATSVDTYTVMVSEGDSRILPGPTLTPMDLDLEADVLKDALNQLVLLPPPEPQPGPWCRGLHCPAAAQCPATIEALAETLPASALVRQHRLSPVIQDEEHAAWTLTSIGLVETALATIKTRLREYADANGGIPLADGTVWAGQETTQERPLLDIPGAVEAIRDAGAEAAIEYSTTWAAIGRAVGKAEAKALREKLSAMGATKSSTFPKYEARKPKKSRAA